MFKRYIINIYIAYWFQFQHVVVANLTNSFLCMSGGKGLIELQVRKGTNRTHLPRFEVRSFQVVLHGGYFFFTIKPVNKINKTEPCAAKENND